MENRTLKIICFAGLRKYFGNETTVVLAPGSTYAHVIDELVAVKPEAKDVLSSCRIAVNEEFIQFDEEIKPTDTLFLIPPSSGG